MKYSWTVLLGCSLWLMSAVGISSPKSEDSANEATKRPPIGLDGIELKEEESGSELETKRVIIPPYYAEQRGSVTLKTVFPVYFSRTRSGEGARTDSGILPFYWAHDAEDAKARVYFPFYWRFRNPSFAADIVLQTHSIRTDDAFHFGFSPFLYFGRNHATAESYQIVLPPLFWNFKKPDGGFLLTLLYYDHREGNDYRRGFVPFFFSKRERGRSVSTILPPLFWHVNNPMQYETTTVLPPLFLRTRETGWSAGLLPILYFARDETWSRNMFMPFYYGSRVGELKSHYFPFALSYFQRSSDWHQGGVAFLYHWKRRDGQYLDMISPLVWRYGNTRTLERNLLVPPLFYVGSSPVSKKIMAGLVYWNFNDDNYKKTLAVAPLFAHHTNFSEQSRRTWVFPTFDVGKGGSERHFRLHPLLYLGEGRDRRHLVIPPLLWHFEDSRTRNSVVFPLWWQFQDKEYQRLRRVAFPLWWQFDDTRRHEYRRSLFPVFWDFRVKEDHRRTLMTFPPVFWHLQDEFSSRTGVLNISLHRGTLKGNPFWTFNLFPLLLIGKPPAEDGARWELLHGFVGWRRQGDAKQLKLLWIPIPVSR